MSDQMSNAAQGLPPEAEAWLAEHPNAEPSGLEEVWQLAAYAQPPEATFEPDADRVDAMRQAIQTSITAPAQPAGTTTRSPLRLVRTTPRVWAIAAVITLLMAVGAALWLQPLTLTAPAGEVLAATLPDGSQVELNSGATLSYRRTFGWQARAVELHGEGYFNVVSGTKPFQVETFNSTVTVLGTQFNVRAWPGDPVRESVVVLEEGRVRFAASVALQQGVELAPGQMSRVLNTATSPSEPVEVPVDRFMAWRTGGMAFTDQPVETILAEIERRFDIAINTSAVSIQDQHLSLYLNTVESVEEVLDVVCGYLDLRYEATANGYAIIQ